MVKKGYALRPRVPICSQYRAGFGLALPKLAASRERDIHV